MERVANSSLPVVKMIVSRCVTRIVTKINTSSSRPWSHPPIPAKGLTAKASLSGNRHKSETVAKPTCLKFPAATMVASGARTLTKTGIVTGTETRFQTRTKIVIVTETVTKTETGIRTGFKTPTRLKIETGPGIKISPLIRSKYEIHTAPGFRTKMGLRDRAKMDLPRILATRMQGRTVRQTVAALSIRTAVIPLQGRQPGLLDLEALTVTVAVMVALTTVAATAVAVAMAVAIATVVVATAVAMEAATIAKFEASMS
jgi:hypothetical protein